MATLNRPRVVVAEGSDPTPLIWLKERAEARLMIVGHDPAFSELVGLLATGEPRLSVAELKKGGVAAFCAEPEGELKLDWLAPPKLIRRLVR